MRYLFLLPLLALIACSDSDTAADGPVTMRGGDVTLTVDADFGARITSLTFQGRELLQTERDSAGLTFGSTAWTSPQSDWEWPPIAAFDSQPYDVREVREGVMLFQSRRDPKTDLVMSKRIALDSLGTVQITYYVRNEGATPVKVAPWEVTRLPYGGRVEFRGDSLRLMDEDAALTDAVELTEDSLHIVRFDDRFTAPGKLFTDLRDSVARFVHAGVVFTKYTEVNHHWQTAPEQAPLEIYWDPPKGFVEFELQGFYVEVQPGRAGYLWTKWELREE